MYGDDHLLISFSRLWMSVCATQMSRTAEVCQIYVCVLICMCFFTVCSNLYGVFACVWLIAAYIQQ